MKLKKIHNWFLPSKKNKFHPHALRPVGLSIFLAIFIAIPPLYNMTSVGKFQVLAYASNVNTTDVFTLSNQERTNVGLPALKSDSQLSSAALAKAHDMFAKDYWAHVAPDGTTPWSFIYAAGYDYQTAGENLAKGFNTSAGVVAGWMASEHHKENILNTTFVDVGYAAVNGVLQGSETTLVVAMYGSRVAPVATAPTAQTPVSSTPSTTQSTTSTSIGTEPSANQPSSKNDSKGLVEGLASSLPVKTYQSFNWGQKASIALVCTMILLFLLKHTLIWRERKYGVKHIMLRSHPVGQALLLTLVLVMTLLSSAGTIL
jgi:hypothetical protein